MDKELTEIAPTNLDRTEVVNTVKKASEEDAKAAAIAEKEKKENYYVDPLEQEALMKEKLAKIEAEKERKRKEEYGDDEVSEPEIDESIRPDMNVSGFFSAGNTATKVGVMRRPASSGFLSFCMVYGIFSVVYSSFYTIILISSNFSSTSWFLTWLFVIFAIIALVVIFNSIRSLKAQKDSLKRKAMIGLIGSLISLFPIIAWAVHLITQLLF